MTAGGVFTDSSNEEENKKSHSKGFENLAAGVKKVNKVAKANNLTYAGLEQSRPRKNCPYRNECRHVAETIEIPLELAQKQFKIMGYRMRNLSNAMKEFLSLGNYNAYYKEKYQITMNMLEKDRRRERHRANILKYVIENKIKNLAKDQEIQE